MNKKYILLTSLLIWFLLSGIIIYYLVINDMVSTDIWNTYVYYKWEDSYNAPIWYFEYFMTQEWWWINKYLWNHVTNFGAWIDITNN